MISINKFNFFRKKNRSENETREETFTDAPEPVRKNPSVQKVVFDVVPLVGRSRLRRCFLCDAVS